MTILHRWIMSVGKTVKRYSDLYSGEILCGDYNATLVIWKNLLNPKDNLGKTWLHVSIFHLINMIKENMCSLVIDNSSENMIWTEIVKNLQININSHPKHYKLT